MKIARSKKIYNSKFALLFLLGLICLTNLSCGLEVYILMPEPVATVTKEPNIDNTDTGEKYFEFVTNESSEEYAGLGDFKYRGTEVY